MMPERWEWLECKIKNAVMNFNIWFQTLLLNDFWAKEYTKLSHILLLFLTPKHHLFLW